MAPMALLLQGAATVRMAGLLSPRVVKARMVGPVAVIPVVRVLRGQEDRRRVATKAQPVALKVVPADRNQLQVIMLVAVEVVVLAGGVVVAKVVVVKEEAVGGGMVNMRMNKRSKQGYQVMMEKPLFLAQPRSVLRKRLSPRMRWGNLMTHHQACQSMFAAVVGTSMVQGWVSRRGVVARLI